MKEQLKSYNPNFYTNVTLYSAIKFKQDRSVVKRKKSNNLEIESRNK